ncbi:protein kinase [Actinomadura madurae]|nr:serine/threonine protein kinase [Actinomadura madurae]MCQ0004839.1 protein kinase [Actinomadura madurae]
MPHPDLPERIGPYRVVDRLGEGGMGTVYAGLDTSGRKVAIKVIRREFAADRQYRARFQAEVAAAQRVRPFCTAPVLDADPAAEPPYLVTEFVNGPSLDANVVKEGPLRGADLEAVAVGIATALTAIHDAGVVHRDLKPANVLLSTFGPRVIDFGIARSLDGTRLTATGGIVGTPAFMAPEQLDGRGATPASDVFAWGATVAFAAKGGPCFGGNSIPAIIHQIVSGEPDLSGLDGTLLGAVRAALAKDPARRPSAQSLLDGLISSGVRQQPDRSRTSAREPVRERAQAPSQQSQSAQQASVQPSAQSRGPQTSSIVPPPASPLAAGEAEALVERQYRQAAQARRPGRHAQPRRAAQRSGADRRGGDLEPLRRRDRRPPVRLPAAAGGGIPGASGGAPPVRGRVPPARQAAREQPGDLRGLHGRGGADHVRAAVHPRDRRRAHGVGPAAAVRRTRAGARGDRHRPRLDHGRALGADRLRRGAAGRALIGNT